MVFGKTGAGKSHLANTLLGFPAFASGDSLASVTNEQSVRRAISRDGSLTLLDTIGFGDTSLPPETVIKSLRDTALEAPEGIDALLFVMKKERVTAVEHEIFTYVTTMLFGPNCLPNMFIVVTRAGRLAKDIGSRGPRLKEQTKTSTQFGAMVGALGGDPVEKVLFVENPDPKEAEDEEDRQLSMRKQERTIAEIRDLLSRHNDRPYRHSIMQRAGELHNAHLQELRKELRSRIEEEVRAELARERGVIQQDGQKLRQEVEKQRQDLEVREEEMSKRFEDEWTKVREEFITKAKHMTQADLEPIAQEVVEKAEKKSGGRRCVVM